MGIGAACNVLGYLALWAAASGCATACVAGNVHIYTCLPAWRWRTLGGCAPTSGCLPQSIVWRLRAEHAALLFWTSGSLQH